MDMIATTFDIARSFLRGGDCVQGIVAVATLRPFARANAVLSDRPPNGSRLSCGALKRDSFLLIYARRQLEARVRQRPGARTVPVKRSDCHFTAGTSTQTINTSRSLS